MPITINPATEEQIETYEYINRQELTRKIELANGAFSEWKQTSYEHRKNLFLKLADLMNERKDELALIDTTEMGMLLSN